MNNPNDMSHEECLARYLELCRQIYAQMKRDNSWPWITGAQLEDNSSKFES